MRIGAAVHASPSWDKALAEHDAAVTAFIAVANEVPAAQWDLPQAPGKWTPAQEVLHIALSYEAALHAVRTGTGMRPRVSPMRARLLRWIVLPLILNSSWFPQAKAPVEVRPPADGSPGSEGGSREALRDRIERRAREIGDELPHAATEMRFHHAYFGELAPRQALRMLSAHTRHHTRVLGRRFRKVME